MGYNRSNWWPHGSQFTYHQGWIPIPVPVPDVVVHSVMHMGSEYIINLQTLVASISFLFVAITKHSLDRQPLGQLL